MAIIKTDGSKGPVIDLPATGAAAAYDLKYKQQVGVYKPYSGATNDSINGILAGISTPSSGGSGGGGGSGRGGGGSLDYSDPNVGSTVRDHLIFWFGESWVNSNLSAVSYHLERKSTSDDIRRYAVDNGANGYGMQQVKSVLTQALYGMVGGTMAGALPDSLYRTLIRNGAYEDADVLGASILAFKDIGWDKAFDPITGAPVFEPFFDMWEDMTAGADFGWTVKSKLQSIVNQFGFGNEALVEFERWVKTTNGAKTGNYGAEVRVKLKNTLEPLLGRALTEAELAVDGPLWDKDDAALYEWAQTTPEYMAKFEFKPPGVSEQEFLATQSAWNVVFRQAYGIDVAGLSGMPGTNVGVQLTDEGKAKMAQFGFATFDEWAAYAGGIDRFAQIAKDSGWVVDSGAFGSVGGAPGELIAWGFANGVGPAEWMQHVQWEQEAIVAEGTYEPTMLRTLGLNLSSDDWYKYTSKAIGWADIHLQIMEAQNRDQFREVFRNYTGHDPSVSDFNYLATSFVSPSEYARRMAAKESAAEMLPQANELMNRVFGHGTTLDELENVAMGGQGSGALKAQLNQAARLDEYRWTHKQKYGTEPTPTDYARYAGYAGPAELEWELNLAEGIDEFGPDIQEVWKKVYNQELSQEELRIMLGDMVGSGELKYKYKQAKEEVTELEQAHDAGFTTPDAMHMYTGAKEGGIKNVLPGIADMSIA